VAGKKYRDWQQYSAWQTVQGLAAVKWLAVSTGVGNIIVDGNQSDWQRYSGWQKMQGMAAEQ